MNPWNGKVNSFETNYWEMTKEGSTIAMKLKSGYSYQFENDVLKNIARIDLMDSDSENKDTLFIANDQGSTTIPYIYLNGDFNAMTGEWGDEMSAVYVLPYATEVTPSLKSQKHIGHIVAPNAYVHDMNGDVNGCFIAKSLNLTGSESHMFPYHGQKIKNNNTTPEQPGDNTQGGNENPGENNPGTGNEEKPSTPEQPGDNTQGGNENPGENNPGTGNEEKPSTPKQPGDNTQDGNQKQEEVPKTGIVTTNPKPSNDTNNSSTNNEIILNKEELTTNISRKQNTPKISSNKNSKVIVEDNKQTNVKQNDSIKTGDDTHLFMYVLLELLAFVGIVSLRKKA